MLSAFTNAIREEKHRRIRFFKIARRWRKQIAVAADNALRSLDLIDNITIARMGNIINITIIAVRRTDWRTGGRTDGRTV